MNSYSASSISRRGLIAGVAVAAAALAGCSGGEKGGAASGAGSASASSGGSRTLRVAMELAYPPFEGKDSAGNPAGVSVTFMQDFADAYGYDLTIENVGFDGLIPSLQTGKADCVMSSITITPEREEEVDFTDPYAMAQLAILVKRTPADMKGFEEKKEAIRAGVAAMKRQAVQGAFWEELMAQSQLDPELAQQQ